MKTLATAFLTALRSGSYTPVIRITAGSTTLTETRVLKYEVVEKGRLGEASLTLDIDNSDGTYNSLLNLKPRQSITTQEGLKVGHVEHLSIRHVWILTRSTPAGKNASPATIRIEAKNNADKLSAVPSAITTYTAQSIGAIADDIATQAGLTLTRDTATFWTHVVDWQLPATASFAASLDRLMGDSPHAHARAHGRFETTGAWFLKGLSASPAADLNVGASGQHAIYEAKLAYHDAATWVQINSKAGSAVGEATELLTELGTRRRFVNAHALPSSALANRLAQELLEQRENRRHGTLKIQPHLGLQLWDVVSVSAVAGVTDATKFRIEEIHFTYKPGTWDMLLHVREATSLTTSGSSSTQPSLPNITGLAATYNGNDCVISWNAIDLQLFPNFHWYQVTIDSKQRTIVNPHYIYTFDANAADHAGIPDPTLTISVVAVDHQGNTSATPATLTITNTQASWNLSSVLFAQQTVTPFGGILIVGKDEGNLAATAAPADTSMDFAKAMTLNDFVLFKGVGKVEYVQVGTLVSGTRYNVTRNLDASTADEWLAGTPFMVLGNTGDGRIELNASDTPRINLFTQGATFGASTERTRLGDLNGNWGYVAATYGIALGEYAASRANLTWDPTNGLRLRSFATTYIQLDNPGVVTIGQVAASQGNVLISGGDIRLRVNTTTKVLLDNAGAITVGEVAASQGNVLISGGDIRLRVNTTTRVLLDNAGAITVGETGAGQSNVLISGGDIRLRNATTTHVLLDNAGVVLIGQTGAGQSNIRLANGDVTLRNDTTNGIVLDNAGDITIGRTAAGQSNTFISGAFLRMRVGTTSHIVLDGTNSDITVGLTSAGQSNVFISGGVIRMRVATTSHIVLDGTNSDLTVGQVGAGLSNVFITNGAIQLRNNTTRKVDIQADGDIFIGENVAAAATTNLAIFTTAQTYNGEAVGVGDLLIGDNSASKANAFWDKSAGRINFRGGTTVQAYIDTDGTVTAGGGNVKINASGITLTASATTFLLWKSGTSSIVTHIGNKAAGAVTYTVGADGASANDTAKISLQATTPSDSTLVEFFASDAAANANYFRVTMNSTLELEITTSAVTLNEPLTVSSAANQKILLEGSASPYIQFRNAAGADIGYVQVNNASEMRVNQQQNQPLFFFTNNLSRWQITAAGHFDPTGAGTQNIGNATDYINDLSYKTLTDRGCLGWFEEGVELQDGRVVSDVEALRSIRKHDSLMTVYGTPRLDYASMPTAVYKPAPIVDGLKQGDDGAETTALLSIMLGAIKELDRRLATLEHA